eukprot:jgi/Galph1/3587/GphlegSOOS_G2275.1
MKKDLLEEEEAAYFELEDAFCTPSKLLVNECIEVSILIRSLGLVKGEFQSWKEAIMVKKRIGLFMEPKISLVVKLKECSREKVHLSFSS